MHPQRRCRETSLLRNALAAASEWVAIVLALGASVAAAASTPSVPDLPVPEGAQLSPLADRMRINGQEARLHELFHDGSVESLFDFYRQRFGKTASEPSNTPGQRIVGGVVGDTYVTVQVPQPADATGSGVNDRGAVPRVYARVMQMRLSAQSPRRPAGRTSADMPIGSRTLSDVESQDGNRLAHLRVYRNQHSVDANVAFVRRRFEDRGLALVDSDPGSDAKRALMWFADAHGGEAMLFVQSVGDSRVVTVHAVAELKTFAEQR